MAPKKVSTNGFMMFTVEWKTKYGKQLSLREATAQAGKIWENMNMQERAPYNEKAKEEKLKMRMSGEKFTCIGTLISQEEKEKLEVEQKEKQIKRIIEQTIRNSEKEGGTQIYGRQYEAQHHSETTHNLPLPPDAMGDKNLGKIYNSMLKFVRTADNYPPLYTLQESIKVVVSVLDFLKSDLDATNIHLNIYPIQYLFYVMKESTCEQGELDKPKSFHITDAYFERDYFEYQSGIACQFHEDADKSKYCAQSVVTRWGYMFSDYMCRDIAIPILPGRHVPQNTNLEAIITPAPSNCSDTNSLISRATSSNYSKKIAANSNYDDQETTVSSFDETKTSYNNHFPALGARKKIPPPAGSKSTSSTSRKNYVEEYYSILSDDGKPELHPWASRSHHPKSSPPAESNFKVTADSNKDHDTDTDIPIYNFGRGRRVHGSNIFGNNVTGFGRGRLP
uniref:HMG box domain-containing protein n=1 Tax=Glossina brevipalpis TaxID=37001 RepID=A0A1A9X579_9MUSC